MSKQVKDILATHDTGCPHGITFAIHQNKEECIALFGRFWLLLGYFIGESNARKDKK